MKISKRGHCQRFSKDIIYLFYGRDIIQLNNSVCDLFSEKMVFYWDVLSLGMKNRILGDTNGISVITVNCNRIIIVYLQICKSLNHP
jgi:hypothetical protein